MLFTMLFFLMVASASFRGKGGLSPRLLPSLLAGHVLLTMLALCLGNRRLAGRMQKRATRSP